MDSESEKLCMEEIDHVVLDNDKKVTLAFVSNNWSIPNKDSEIILEKWLKRYSGDKKIAKEYLVRGTDVNGNAIISIVSEKNLPKLDKICPNHTRILYSIEVSSANGRTLNIQEPTTNKYIGLKLESEKRSFKSTRSVAPPVKKAADPPAPKKPTNLFSAVPSKPAQSKEVKSEKNPINTAKEVKKEVKKEEKTSPSRTQSPKKGQAPSKSAKAPQAKSSIASFFSSKPSTSTTTAKPDKLVAEATTKIESVTIKDEPVEVTTNETKNTQKRPHSNTSDSNGESKSTEKKNSIQSKKKIKLEPKSSRSRLLQICDSSSDEEDASNAKDSAMDVEEEPVVKKEKENKTPSPEKLQNSKTNGSSDGKKRRTKIKKMVTKTYEDEDGFINTMREMEEVSCSDEEPEAIQPPPKKFAPTSSNGSASATAPASKKKVSPPVAGKKQGSILSFFGKK